MVVTKAWGVDLRHDLTPYHFNKVGAWFEVMLRDKYPGTSVHTIYHQRTVLLQQIPVNESFDIPSTPAQKPYS